MVEAFYDKPQTHTIKVIDITPQFTPRPASEYPVQPASNLSILATVAARQPKLEVRGGDGFTESQFDLYLDSVLY